VPFAQWVPGTAIPSPAYLDANVLVGGLVRSHSLYPSAARMLGDLLAANTHILLSDVAVSESYWALTKIAYCDLFRHRYSVQWNKSIFKRHHQQIFAQQGAKVDALRGWISGLVSAGYPIDVVRSTQPQWVGSIGQTGVFMNTFGLTTADALHLALAEVHAQAFITADRDYRAVMGGPAPANLTVVLVQ
jgi:predicted nucleic acid-binding protein